MIRIRFIVYLPGTVREPIDYRDAFGNILFKNAHSFVLLRRSRGIARVCSPEVTHYLTEERGNDAGF
jgi:hypothetical protein